MKIEVFGIVLEVYRSISPSARERRRRAALVLTRCGGSKNVIDRVKAVRSLGPDVFPELSAFHPDAGIRVGLYEAKKWVESAFMDNGHGDIA